MRRIFKTLVRLALVSAAALLADHAAAAENPTYDVHALPLPGATPAGISMDYIAFDPSTRFVWVPAGTPPSSTSSTRPNAS